MRLEAADIVRLFASIVICEGAGLVGALFTTPAIPGWYAEIKKPGWTPPGSTIGLVWTILFALMGVALFLVWRAGFARAGVPLAIGLFGVQLVLNVLWSWAFFGMRSPLAGLVEIAVLWVAIAATIVAFWRVSSWAGVLLVPYLFWVSFASYLTFSIWRLNR